MPNNYLSIKGQLPENEIIATLNNPHLKSRTADHLLVFGGVSNTANVYRTLSITLYKKIDSLLGTQPTSYPNILSTVPKKDLLKQIIGEYTELKSANPATLSLSDKVDHLELQHSSFKGTKKVYWNGSNYYFIENSFPYGFYKQYKNEKEQHVMEYTNGIIKKVYIKTSDLSL